MTKFNFIRKSKINSFKNRNYFIKTESENIIIEW